MHIDAMSKQGYSPQAMDPLTASLHDCAHRFIPHVKDNQCAATIRYGDSYYTIVIQKQPVQVSYTPHAVMEMLKQMEQKSILGKRPHDKEDGNVVLCDRMTYQRTGYDLTDDTLYPSLGHEFK